jgi:cytochrome c peroxidase
VHERWYGWDGAADSLWAQSIRPLLDPREMGGSAALARRLMTMDIEMACRYRVVAGRNVTATATATVTATATAIATAKSTTAPITDSPASPARVTAAATSAMSTKSAPIDDEALLVDVAKLIAAYVGSLVSGRTAFDEFRDALLRGDSAAAARYPLAAQRGLKLFVGRAGCGNCHVGPMFSNGEFADIGRPFFIRPGVVDPGRQGGIVALRASRYNLLSHWADRTTVDSPELAHRGASAGAGDARAVGLAGGAVHDESLKTRYIAAQHRNFGEFKVPSLRNVALTVPYMHDGSIATLDGVLSHYSELDLERLHADGEQLLKPQHFSPMERADLLAFLRSLSDPAARVAPVVPDLPCELGRGPG